MRDCILPSESTLVRSLLGTPDAGKGTQSPVLEERFGPKQLFTGDKLRAAIAARIDARGKAETVMQAGALASDAIIAQTLTEPLEAMDCAQGVVQDQFPRTMAEAEAGDGLLEEAERRFDAVIEFKVDDARGVARTVEQATICNLIAGNKCTISV
ncbi:MAG: nucleoside monophosphate kinase [Pseudomonadota bacterium]